MRIASTQRLLFIGDSITDCGRARPVGERRHEGLGTGYVARVADLLESGYPERSIRVTNVGTSGHTVRDLAARWDADVIAQEPDIVSVCIGINDVWRQFDAPQHRELHVGLEEYRATLADLVARTLPLVDLMLLASPYYLEPNRDDPMRATMDAYGAAMRSVAEAAGCRFADVQAGFDRVLQHRYPAEIAWDRIHPNGIGHLVIARAILDALDFDWGHAPEPA